MHYQPSWAPTECSFELGEILSDNISYTGSRGSNEVQKENLLKITELRHELHMHPELSMQEIETAGRLKSFLRRNTGFRIVDRGNWFYAVKKGKGGRGKIAFRADMDALPIEEDDTLRYHSKNAGVSHKCGHDGHCAALCGLALELDAAETNADIYLIIQPGEEIGKGAVLCRELLRQEEITQIYAFHNLSGYPEKSIVYRSGLTQPASEGLRICFEGLSSHASAPEEGKNPAEVIARVVLHALELAEDQSDGMLLCTITGIKLGAGDFGISPGDGELCMTLRAEEESRMKALEEQIIEYAREEAHKCGIRMDSSIHDYFPETRNHAQCLDAVIGAASDLGAKLIPMKDMWRASEDFGWYLKECPGAIIYIGNGEEYPALHTADYDFNDRILETAVDLFKGIAVR